MVKVRWMRSPAPMEEQEMPPGSVRGTVRATEHAETERVCFHYTCLLHAASRNDSDPPDANTAVT